MMKTVFFCLALASLPHLLSAQDASSIEQPLLAKAELRFAPEPPAPQDAEIPSDRVYQFNWKVDAPVTAVGALWSAYAFTKIYDKPSSSLAEIEALDKNDINGFDRWAAGMDDDNIDKSSDYLFYGVMPLPVVLFADKHIRKDAAKIGMLYLETFAITGALYTGSTYFTNRYRPETYNENKPAWDKLGGGYKNSFFAGHVAVVGTATFFTAKVFADYHPESKLKWVFYGAAAAATGTMVYMRHKAGKHFPSDLVVGTAVGVLSGILVPHFHKVNRGEDRAWRLSPSVDPYGGGYGLGFTYKFK